VSTIAVQALTKRFGAVTALEDVTFDALPGHVTGFFGANGAGKSTTLRLVLGLSRPTSGRATIGGRLYRDLAYPTRTVGAVLEHSPFHPTRSARNALRVLATASGVELRRVDEVLAIVRLTDVADAAVGRFSLGMRQRLALAAALLGDPEVLVLDEPTNGLDPGGLLWMRSFLRTQAATGRTVLLSSHLLAEMAECVDDAVVIAAGRLTFAGSIADLRGPEDLLVRARDRRHLLRCLQQGGVNARVEGDMLVRVTGATAERVGGLCAVHGVALLELRCEDRSVEVALRRLVGVATSAEAPWPIAGTKPQRQRGGISTPGGAQPLEVDPPCDEEAMCTT
jgi:ABC-2 type transport system ATP-binding protein